MLNVEKLKGALLRSGTSQLSLSQPLFDIVLEDLARAIGQEKERTSKLEKKK
jgi:hypothetical protein